MDSAVHSGHNDIESSPPPAFHGRESPPAWLWHTIRRRNERALRNPVANFANQTDRFMNLVHSHAPPRPDTAVSVEHHFYAELVIGGKGAVTPDILIDP